MIVAGLSAFTTNAIHRVPSLDVGHSLDASLPRSPITVWHGTDNFTINHTKRSTAGRRLVLDPSESDMVLTLTTIYHRDETIPPLPLTSLAPSTYPRVSNGHDRVLLYSPSFPSSAMAAPCERRKHRDAISRRIRLGHLSTGNIAVIEHRSRFASSLLPSRRLTSFVILHWPRSASQCSLGGGFPMLFFRCV